MLAVNSVSFDYPGARVLDDVSFTVDRGVTALVGLNGAGKTSLIRVLATVSHPSSGTVVSDSGDIFGDAAALREYRMRLGWVPQRMSFPRGLKVREYLRYAAWLKGVAAPRVQDCVDDILDVVDVRSFEKMRLEALSGGMRQRVILGAALIGQPRILLLDEPTVGLDPEQRASFLRVVAHASLSSSVILSTHLLEDIVGVARKAILLEKGKVGRQLDIDADMDTYELRNELFPNAGERD